MKQLTICGFGSPRFVPKNGDVWTMNNFHKRIPEIHPHRVYEIHGNNIINKESLYEKNLIDIWKDVEVVVIEPHGFKNEIIFDIDAAIEKFGAHLFTSSICYMLSDSFDYDRICLNGVELLAGDEYTEQMPAVIEWIKLLRDAGKEVIAPWEQLWSIPEGYEPMLYGCQRFLKKHSEKYGIKISHRGTL